MNPWIQNISRDAVRQALHIEPGPNCMLIQLSDPPGNHPRPLRQFREVHQFDFLDIEEGDPEWDELGEFAITQEQAAELVRLLQHALENRMNVIVHCHAGICRSGAVCEVGVMMGFRDTEVYRQPNLLVKNLMMRELGWTYE